MRNKSGYGSGGTAGVAAIATTLLLWLGACGLVDGVMMPTMNASGMLGQPGFVVAGYQFFSTFNQLELLAGAIALTGALVAWKQQIFQGRAAAWSLISAAILLLVAGIDTLLTPRISGLALNLEVLPNTVEMATKLSGSMMALQETYWGIEALKLVLALTMLIACWRVLASEGDRVPN